jgi:hypothetical protein
MRCAVGATSLCPHCPYSLFRISVTGRLIVAPVANAGPYFYGAPVPSSSLHEVTLSMFSAAYVV